VVQALVFNELLIVRVEPDVGKIFNRNIFAYSKDCQVRWQIEESPHGTEVDKPYTSIALSGKNDLTIDD